MLSVFLSLVGRDLPPGGVDYLQEVKTIMRVEVQLQPDAALALHNRQAGPNRGASETESDAYKLRRDLEKMGLRLEPIHPGQTHPLLAPYFMIEVPDRQSAERVLDHLSKYKIVEAAYLRPEDAAP
jgi:hypothetical protein